MSTSLPEIVLKFALHPSFLMYVHISFLNTCPPTPVLIRFLTIPVGPYIHYTSNQNRDKEETDFEWNILYYFAVLETIFMSFPVSHQNVFKFMSFKMIVQSFSFDKWISLHHLNSYSYRLK